MKKTSLMAVMAAVGMMAIGSANAMNNTQNPLYMPMKGQSYVKTELMSADVEGLDSVIAVDGEYGFGVMNNWYAYLGIGYMDLEMTSGATASDTTKPRVGTVYRFMDQGMILDGKLEYSVGQSDNEVTDDRDELVYGIRLGQHVDANTTWAFTVDGIYTDKSGAQDAETDVEFGLAAQTFVDKMISINGMLGYTMFDSSNSADSEWSIGAQANYHFTNDALLGVFVAYAETDEPNADGETYYGLRADFQF